MKKGQVIEGVIERVDFPNKGIFTTEEGKQVIVKNGIPRQKVAVSISKIRKGKCEGRLLEVLEKAPIEQNEPGCVHFHECGGCTYQTLPYEEQLKMKAEQVKKLIDDVLAPISEGYEFLEIKASPTQKGYRNKMEFSFGDSCKDGPLALGMHKRGSFYDIVPVPECQIADEDFRTILTTTLDFFAERGIAFYHKMRHEGYLRHLLVRKAVKTGEILVDLVTSTQLAYIRTDDACRVDERNGGNLSDVMEAEEQALLNEWKEVLLAKEYVGKMTGILHTRNDSLADVVANHGTDILYGQDYFFEELLGLRFKITPFSFFQTNSLGAEVLYETAREFIGNALTEPEENNMVSDLDSVQEDSCLEKKNGGKIVFDLYSGTGTIAQILAPVAQKVIGVEIVEEAVEAAKINAELNGLNNCEFIAGDVLKVIDTIEEKPDYIVLDPPRDGIHPKALEKIIKYGVPQMVYISCKPTSLARDLEVLQARGYKVEKVCCVDMFPQTANVETVCLLSKLQNRQHIEIELNMDELDVTDAEKKATYEEIKSYVFENTGLKVSNLYIAQVKQKYGIIERENYNKPKSEDSRQPQCPKEKEDAIIDALKHFGMI